MLLSFIKNIIKSWPLPRFASCGPDVIIARARFVLNPAHIDIGSKVYIGKDSTLAALCQPNGTWGHLTIGSGVWATARLSIFSLSSVIIEDDVLIAGNVFVSDSSRGHATAELPYKQQPSDSIAPIVIGEGSWLGQNAVIMPGVTVGRRSIIGANSVVTRSIPAGSVAVGSPARIVKHWDWEMRVWRKMK